MWKRGLFYLIRILFHSLTSKTLSFSALETTQKWRRTHMLAKTMSESLPPSHAFLSSSHIKLQCKMMKLNIKVGIISLLLSRIHRKMENYFCIPAEIWLLPDDLRHLSVNSPKHHTQASNSIISMSMVRGLALQSNSIKRQSVSGHVSEYTWNNKQNRTEWPLKMFTCKMGRTLVIRQKTFSENVRYKQMNKRRLQLLQVSDF